MFYVLKWLKKNFIIYYFDNKDNERFNTMCIFNIYYDFGAKKATKNRSSHSRIKRIFDMFDDCFFS